MEFFGGFLLGMLVTLIFGGMLSFEIEFGEPRPDDPNAKRFTFRRRDNTDDSNR